jgi:hypothetical protein
VAAGVLLSAKASVSSGVCGLRIRRLDRMTVSPIAEIFHPRRGYRSVAVLEMAYQRQNHIA